MHTTPFHFSVGGLAAIALITAVTPAPEAAPMRLHYVVAPAGNEARYRVREQLVGVDFPNDAVGVTNAITGTLVVDTAGVALSDSSRFVVDVSTLKSDKDRRDGYIKRATLETTKFPTVELVPTAIKGVSGVPPQSGTHPIELTGQLTVRGVTRPTTWKGSATFVGNDLTGSISTAFTFKDFGMQQPRVAVLLSVEDTIKLEYDFHLIQQR